MEETELIQSACQGNLDAFNQLVLEYQTAVYNQALWILRDREAAEDFTQEAFILAFQNLNRYRGGSFRSWLLRIATNASLDELRRKKRRPTLSLTRQNNDGEELDTDDWLVDPSASVEESFEQIELRRTIQRTIDELPEEYRQTVLLVDVLEMDYAEAARSMGVPIGTVKSRLVRARKHLRERLERKPGLVPTRMMANSVN